MSKNKTKETSPSFKCIGGPLDGRYKQAANSTFIAEQGDGKIWTYNFDVARGVFICKEGKDPEWDFDFYAVPVPELGISKVIAICPIFVMGKVKARYLSYEHTVELDQIDAVNTDDFLAALTEFFLSELVPFMSEEECNPRIWQDGERQKVFAHNQPPAPQ